ncbi:MAG: phenylacetate--CoA ligase family protein, partial [Candidatus Krumholzibacteria bacterium]|nr:phenylacetate--CoA ligase family protein [Candidatus Krumholzibacteria bacterium]
MLYNFILEKIVLPVGDLIFGYSFIKELDNWRSIQELSAKEISELQERNLRGLLQHATRNVPYYRNRNIPFNENPYEWIKNFPILRKSDIKENINAITSGNKDKLLPHVGSGSSGIQCTVYLDKKEESIANAIQMLWWEWSGYKIGDKLIQTGMTPNRGLIKSLKDYFFRTKYVAAYDYSEAFIVKILETAERSSGFSLAGYASSLFPIALIARKRKKEGIRFKTVIAWGDKLFPHYRKAIEETFSTRVYETYGCVEGLRIAAQKDLEYMYIMSPHIYLEIVDEKGVEVPDGEMGYVLVTRLDGYSMPLIRYYLGDLAIKLPEEKYPKHRELNFPILQKVIGRDTDIVRTRSGKFVIVHFFTGIFEHIPEIKQFKVTQYNLDGVTIEFIRDKNFSLEILTRIKNQILGYIKEPFKIDFVEVQEIKASPSGKP